MKNSIKLAIIFLIAATVYGCKSNTEVSTPEVVIGAKFTGDTLKGSIKGTIVGRANPYYMTADVTVNAGDTLFIKEGVKIIVIGDPKNTATFGQATNNPTFFINGTLLAVGTKTSPIEFTINDALKGDLTTKQDPNTDPAFKGYWGGFVCDGADLVVFKWAKVGYIGGPWGANPPTGYASGDPKYGISYLASKTNAKLIVEDSYFYGSTDDCIRTQNVKLSIMRNKFAKTGKGGGEAVNVKDGCQGDIAYNLVIGGATNGFKIASIVGTSNQTNISLYNNTIVNTGYRQTKSGRGGSINIEVFAKGRIYNNLIVNCRFGLRLRATPDNPDVANISYDNQYYYGTTADMVAEFNAATAGSTTISKPNDIRGNATENNPSFKSYAISLLAGTTAVPSDDAKRTNFYLGTDDFGLSAGSKAVGKGNSTITILNLLSGVSVKDIFIPSVTLPGKDAGAYQSDGTGIQQ